jgi:hypothetical protein
LSPSTGGRRAKDRREGRLKPRELFDLPASLVVAVRRLSDVPQSKLPRFGGAFSGIILAIALTLAVVAGMVQR